MISLTINGIINETCIWISMNPSYILWPALIGIIILVMAIYLAFKSKASKDKMSSEYQKVCEQLKSYSAQLTALKSNYNNQTVKVQKCQSDLELKKKELVSKDSEIASLASDKRTLLRKINTLNATIEQKEDRLSELEESLAATRRHLDYSGQLLVIERGKQQRFQQENQAAIKKSEELAVKVASYGEMLKAKTDEISKLKEQLEAKECDLKQLHALLSNKDETIEQKNLTIESLETQLHDVLTTSDQEEGTIPSEPDKPVDEGESPVTDGIVPNYNELHKHSRDSLLQFDSENHIYSFNGCEFKSVTNVVDECFAQFDADFWAKKKAPSLGMTPQQVKEMWERKGEESRNLGSLMHEKIERFYLGLPNTPDETYNLFCQFVQQYHLKPYRTEWAIYDEDNKVAGTLDFLNYDDGVFTIYDWKRSNKIIVNGQPEIKSRWGKKAFSPIDHVQDTTYWHYALQVSIYRYILEKNYGINVSAGLLAVFHPDYNRPYVVDVPYMRNEVISVLKNQR